MQVCSCLWGGAYNPIIPVCNELPSEWTQSPFRNPTGEELAKGYIDFFEPDVFVEAESGLAGKARVEDSIFTYGKPRVVSLSTFFESGQEGQTRIPFGLSMFDVYRHLYEREFKFLRRQEQPAVLFETGSDDDTFVEAAFGAFPSEGLLSALGEAFAKTFNAQRLKPSGENWMKVIREECTTPLVLTAHAIRREPDGYGELTLFIADPNSPTDMLDLWNLRQFTPYVVPINAHWASAAAERETLRGFITANYRPLPRNPHGVMIRTTVQFGRSFSEDRAKALGLELFDGLPPGSWSLKPWYERIWRIDRIEDRMVRPRRARFSTATADLDLPLRTEQKDKSIQFRSLSPEFASRFSDGDVRWVNVLRLYTYASDESIAVVFPPDLNKETLMRLGSVAKLVEK
jgi:hypothetical protein